MGSAAQFYRFFRMDLCVGRLTYVTALAFMLAASALVPQSAQAQTENQLYSFKNGPTDGQLPYAGVIRDSKGDLYGTTAYGGAFNHGTIFKISKRVRTLLYSFTGKTDGGFPVGLVLDATGNIYGTTQAYGSSNCGTVFKLRTTGKLTVLHAFTDSSDRLCAQQPDPGSLWQSLRYDRVRGTYECRNGV